MNRFKGTQHKFGKNKPPHQVIKQIVLNCNKEHLCNNKEHKHEHHCEDNIHKKYKEIMEEIKKDV